MAGPEGEAESALEILCHISDDSAAGTVVGVGGGAAFFHGGKNYRREAFYVGNDLGELRRLGFLEVEESCRETERHTELVFKGRFFRRER